MHVDNEVTLCQKRVPTGHKEVQLLFATELLITCATILTFILFR